MFVRYIALGVIGMALALYGIMKVLYPVAALGAALVFAAFFWFMRTNQTTPAPAGPDDSRPVR